MNSTSQKSQLESRGFNKERETGFPSAALRINFSPGENSTKNPN